MPLLERFTHRPCPLIQMLSGGRCAQLIDSVWRRMCFGQEAAETGDAARTPYG